MRKIYTLLSIMVVLLVAGCKTASKLYEKGNYDEAVELAVKKLQKKPDNEMRVLLQSAYQYAVNDHENRIQHIHNLTSELKWEMMYDEYASLQRLYEAIHRSPEAMSVVNAIDYSSYLTTYADRAAETRFDRGMQWMDRNDKLSFRSAYHEFEAALRYRPNDLTIIDRKNEAYENAVINVVMVPAADYRYRYSSYNDHEVRSLENELLRQLQYSTGNEFVRLYSPWEADSRHIEADQFVDLRFTTLNIGRTWDDKSTREVSKDIVVKETVYRPDSVVREYKKVTARITTIKRTMISGGKLQINVRDQNGHRLWSDNVNGDHNWITEFATFTGDERALSDADKALVNRRGDFPPHENEVIRCIISEINSNMSGRLRHYFSRL